MARVSLRRMARGIGRPVGDLTGDAFSQLGRLGAWVPGAGRGRRKLGRRRRSIGAGRHGRGSASKRRKR